MWGMDCFVSLHRAEGFGLTMAETMGMGKAVVATDYSGNLTFMDADQQPAGARTRWCRSRPGNPPYPTDRPLGPALGPARRAHHAPAAGQPRAWWPSSGSGPATPSSSTIPPRPFGAVAAARIEEIRREHSAVAERQGLSKHS